MAQMTFAYTALDAAGVRRSGAVDAETREAAVARLAAEGRFVLEIAPARGAGAAAAGGRRSARTAHRRKQDLALFTRRLADLALAGLPLDRVLQVVAEQSESPVLEAHLRGGALADVRSGMPVSQALAKTPRFFNAVFTQTLRAGEASGQFGEVAERLADYQELEVSRRGQITSALVYPTVLATTSLLVVVFLITFVLPRMSGVFQGLGSDLPLTTRMLLDSSAFLTHRTGSGHFGVLVVGLVSSSACAPGSPPRAARRRATACCCPCRRSAASSGRRPSRASPASWARWSTAASPSWRRWRSPGCPPATASS